MKSETLLIIESLPAAAEIVKEANPFTWILRVIQEGHQYKLAKAEIERAFEKDRNELKLRLEELEARKKAYIATLEHQIKLIETENAPIMETLNTYFNDLNSFNQMVQESHKKILDSAGNMDSDIFKTLISFHLNLFNQKKDIYQQIAITLDNHKSSISDQFGKIHAQITDHNRALSKD